MTTATVSHACWICMSWTQRVLCVNSLLQTLSECFKGLCRAFILSFCIVVKCFSSVEKVIYPYLHFSRSLPLSHSQIWCWFPFNRALNSAFLCLICIYSASALRFIVWHVGRVSMKRRENEGRQSFAIQYFGIWVATFLLGAVCLYVIVGFNMGIQYINEIPEW